MKTKNSPEKAKSKKANEEKNKKANDFKSKNQIVLTGNVGKNPEVLEMKDGKKKAFFTMATNNYFYSKENGVEKKEPLWHSLVAWGNLAEQIGDSVKSGDRVSVTGRINNRKYTDRNGANKVFTEIILRSFDIVKAKELA